jgi:hypothetical protein
MSEKYNLMVYFLHSCLEQHKAALLMKPGMTAIEFREIEYNENIVRKVIELAASAFSYSVSLNQVEGAIALLIKSNTINQASSDAGERLTLEQIYEHRIFGIYWKEDFEEADRRLILMGAEEYLQQELAILQKDAIAFAEWLNDNNYNPDFGNWFVYEDGVRQDKTSAELYAIYRAEVEAETEKKAQDGQ